MYAKDDLDIRTRENVKNNGEVFTPTPIVDFMNALIPKTAWCDKSFVFIEPTCGNGQFLTRILEKRISNGLSIEDALNTIIGMDITNENILDSQRRLLEISSYTMLSSGIQKCSKEWFEKAIIFITIVTNNIFKVGDSLKVLSDYGNGKGVLSSKKFVYNDPTGNKQVMSSSERSEMEDNTKKALRNQYERRNINILVSFFK